MTIRTLTTKEDENINAVVAANNSLRVLFVVRFSTSFQFKLLNSTGFLRSTSTIIGNGSNPGVDLSIPPVEKTVLIDFQCSAYELEDKFYDGRYLELSLSLRKLIADLTSDNYWLDRINDES